MSVTENTGLSGNDQPAVRDLSAAASADSSGPAAQKLEKVIETWEEYDVSPMPLLAAIPEKDIRLYAMKPGSPGSEAAITEQVKLIMGKRE